jgi:hypothetical protein
MACEQMPEVTNATIHSCRWEDPPSRAVSSLFVGHFVVAYSYVVDGIKRGGEFYSSHAWEEGTDVPILYNPQNPEKSRVYDDEDDESRAGRLAEAAMEWIFMILLDGP